ncbi:MAG: hypothetical protein OXC26_17700 [Albidovulum sp.]|nr:hypothetical protein [Albidovulum sp.]
MAASLYGGGYDFADGGKATAERVQRREYHHLFPRRFVEQSYPDHVVNCAMNCALISWKTNRKIAAKSPKQYIDERASDANASEEDVRFR